MTDRSLPFRSLVITGEMRSGTTFVANLLNSQSDAVVYADSLRSLFVEARALGIQDVDRALTDREKNVLFSNLEAEALWDASRELEVARDEVGSWFDLFVGAMASLDRKGTARLIGVKATRVDDFIPRLLSHGVRIIYVCRDPRDVLISSMNRFSGYDLFTFTERWRTGVEQALEFRGDPHYLFLKYEDLLIDREATTAILSDFLGIDVTHELDELTIRGEGHRYVANSSFGDVTELFDTSALYRWKSRPESDETVFASGYLSDLIARLGYPSHVVDSDAYHALHARFTRRLRSDRIRTWMRRLYRLAFSR